MKYKLIDGSTFIIAGVASYNTQKKLTPSTDSTQHKQSSSPHKTVKMKFDFDLPNFTFDIDKEAIKRDAQRAKEAALKFKEEAIRFKEEAMKRKEKMDFEEAQKAASSDRTYADNESTVDNSHFEEESTLHNSQAEENSDDSNSDNNNNNSNNNSSNNNSSSNNNGASHNSSTPGMDEFSKYMNEFGKYMSAFGNTMGEYGKNFGKSMQSFGKNFDGLFTKDWVDSMENTFKDLFGEDIDRHWSGNFTPNDYETWQQEALFNELYENNPTLRDADLAPDIYYEVQGYDLGTKMNEQLSFIGCQVKSTKDLPYSVVTHRSSPEQWLVVKLTEDEFNADWMKVIESLDLIKDYYQYPYFILRHFKHADQQQDSLYKIYIPLKDAR